ncbi:MAG TPA: hypothetical protein VI895_01905 [Bdellovibrionota bacterium]|nr:hypothetical protein [Bdellovibrionota bacterium]
MPAGEREIGSSVRFGPEVANPAVLIMAFLAVHSELAGMNILMTRTARLINAFFVGTAFMTSPAQNGLMFPFEEKTGFRMIERGEFPGRRAMAFFARFNRRSLRERARTHESKTENKIFKRGPHGRKSLNAPLCGST